MIGNEDLGIDTQVTCDRHPLFFPSGQIFGQMIQSVR